MQLLAALPEAAPDSPERDGALHGTSRTTRGVARDAFHRPDRLGDPPHAPHAGPA